MKKKIRTNISYLRNALLGAMVILITIAAFVHQTGEGTNASIHALCPFGGLESLYTYISSGDYIQKIFSGTFVLLILTILIVIFFRKSFCGLICPFGAMQEFFGYLGKKVFKKRYVMPSKVDRVLRYFKYVVLFVTLVMAWRLGTLWMAPYDPWSAYAHLPEGISSVWEESSIALLLLILTFIGSFFYDRFFCKYMCPLGAFYNIFAKVSPLKIKRNEDQCVDCGLCNKTCPMNIDVAHSTVVNDVECINCQQCVLSCPKEGALESNYKGRSIKPWLVIVLVFALFFGGIGIAKLADTYQVTPTALVSGQRIELDEVKGYMTINAAADATGLSKEEFYATFKIPSNVPGSTKMKAIKDVVEGYEFDDVKEEVSK